MSISEYPKHPPANPIEWTMMVDGQQTTCVVRACLWYEARLMGAILLGLPIERVDPIFLAEFK